jgi:hypothetical protein
MGNGMMIFSKAKELKSVLMEGFFTVNIFKEKRTVMVYLFKVNRQLILDIGQLIKRKIKVFI